MSKGKPRDFGKFTSDRTLAYLLIAPTLAVLLALSIYPLIYSIKISLQTESTAGVPWSLQNFVRLAGDHFFLISLAHTFIYAASALTIEFLLGLGAMLEIEPLLGRKPRELSGGERQRVALARAIVRPPRAFLMDEPLSNLDARLRLQMRGELKHLQHELGITTVYLTHDQAEAMTLGHRVAVMKKGKLQQYDTPLNIYNHPANRFVAEFVGSPGMNFLDGEVDLKAGTFTTEGIELTLGGVDIEQLNRLNPGGRVTIGIRPEDVQVSNIKRDLWVPASVYVTELMGSETFVFLKLGRKKIVARAPGDFRAETDSQVWIEVDTEKAHFFDPKTSERI